MRIWRLRLVLDAIVVATAVAAAAAGVGAGAGAGTDGLVCVVGKVATTGLDGTVFGGVGYCALPVLDLLELASAVPLSSTLTFLTDDSSTTASSSSLVLLLLFFDPFPSGSNLGLALANRFFNSFSSKTYTPFEFSSFFESGFTRHLDVSLIIRTV